MDRDLAETTPHGVGSFNCYHPTMQKLALRLAVEPARRSGGVTVEAVVPGSPPSVRAQEDGQVRVLQARLAVGADERASRVRRWAGSRPIAKCPLLLLSIIGPHDDRVSRSGRLGCMFDEVPDSGRA